MNGVRPELKFHMMLWHKLGLSPFNGNVDVFIDNKKIEKKLYLYLMSNKLRRKWVEFKLISQ